jgi:predicted DNA binding CopG/RHH family protein
MKKEYDLTKLRKRETPTKTDAEASKIAISLRIDGSVLAALKTEAARLGIPYQTLIGSLLHRYVNGELLDKKALEAAKRFKLA